MDIRPIRTEADHAAALREIEALMAAAPGTADGDRLDVLVTLVQAYEAAHHAIDPPDPVTAIRIAMEDKGLTRADLEPAIGPSGRVSEILNRRRPLTLKMIRALSPLLGIPIATLARPYDLTRDAA